MIRFTPHYRLDAYRVGDDMIKANGRLWAAFCSETLQPYEIRRQYDLLAEHALVLLTGGFDD